jgi:hypothetical protein
MQSTTLIGSLVGWSTTKSDGSEFRPGWDSVLVIIQQKSTSGLVKIDQILRLSSTGRGFAHRPWLGLAYFEIIPPLHSLKGHRKGFPAYAV